MNYVQGRSVVIVAYKPKPGKKEELLQIAREHLPLLRSEGLATDRTEVICQTADGTIVEVFEWEDGGIEKAHTNPKVAELWKRYFECCDILPLNQLPETKEMFAGFAPLAL